MGLARTRARQGIPILVGGSVAASPAVADKLLPMANLSSASSVKESS